MTAKLHLSPTGNQNGYYTQVYGARVIFGRIGSWREETKKLGAIAVEKIRWAYHMHVCICVKRTEAHSGIYVQKARVGGSAT